MKKLSIFMIIMSIFLSGCHREEPNNTSEETIMNVQNIEDIYISTDATNTTSVTATTSTFITENTTKSTTTSTDNNGLENQNDYKNNDFYEVVQTDTYFDDFGNRVVIDVVYGKENCTVKARADAKNEYGATVDTATDELDIVKDEYNFFKYTFTNSDSAKTIRKGVDSVTTNEFKKCINVVEKYKNGDFLSVILEQIDAPIDLYSKIKVVFYSGERIVYEYDNYICIVANDLRGLNQTCIVDIWTGQIEYDSVGITIEP